MPELAAAFGVARYSGTLVAAGTRLIAAATPSEIESVADGIAQAHQAFEGQLATLERSDLSGEHLGPVRAHADGLIANLDAIGDDRAELLELAQRSDAMWVELAGLRNRLDRVVIPGIDDQLFYTMTGNCSDLRGSADYWAHCGGATEHGISTANRFRPLKREQLR